MADPGSDGLLEAARRIVAASEPATHERFIRAAGVTLDTRHRMLRWGVHTAQLGPSTCSVAARLLSHAGETVERTELLAALGWFASPSRYVTRRLDTAIWRLRMVLPGTITPVSGVGYRWDPPREKP